MTITNYTDLQTEVISNSNRSDLTNTVPTFIQLAEADMKRRLKLVDFEGAASITVTSGSGDLPADFAGALDVYWDIATDVPLRYLTHEQYNAKRPSMTDGDPVYYTITGSTIKVLPADTGTAVMTYIARLESLSSTNTTNTVLTNYPDAYFFGTLKWLYHHTRNWDAKAQQAGEFDRVIDQIIRDHMERKYSGPITIRAQ
jgi:hypothetical protein